MTKMNRLYHGPQIIRLRSARNCALFLSLGYRKRPKKGHPRCCWSCIKCGANSISNKTNMDMCIACPSDHWRSQDRSKCYKVTDRYLNWKDNWIKAVVIVSSIGILLVLMTIVVFIWFRNTAVVRASSRQMSYVLLVGVIMFYALPFTMLGKPSKFMCEAMPFTLGLTLALNVGKSLNSVLFTQEVPYKSFQRCVLV